MGLAVISSAMDDDGYEFRQGDMVKLKFGGFINGVPKYTSGTLVRFCEYESNIDKWDVALVTGGTIAVDPELPERLFKKGDKVLTPNGKKATILGLVPDTDVVWGNCKAEFGNTWLKLEDGGFMEYPLEGLRKTEPLKGARRVGQCSTQLQSLRDEQLVLQLADTIGVMDELADELTTKKSDCMELLSKPYVKASDWKSLGDKLKRLTFRIESLEHRVYTLQSPDVETIHRLNVEYDAIKNDDWEQCPALVKAWKVFIERE